MPTVHHIGTKIYVHRMEYPPGRWPLAEVGDTQEIDWPFRTGKGVVIRLPFTRTAVCVGRWGRSIEEDDALTTAIGARWMENHDVA